MSHSTLMTQVRHEFEQLAGVSLTQAQAQRLFGLSSEACEAVLSSLVTDGVIAMTGERRYAIAPKRP